MYSIPYYKVNIIKTSRMPCICITSLSFFAYMLWRRYIVLGVKQQKNTLKLDPTLADMFSLDLSFALGFSCSEARLEGGK